MCRSDLNDRGVALRSPSERMDTTAPHGELPFAIFRALARYDRALTRGRVRVSLSG